MLFFKGQHLAASVIIPLHLGNGEHYTLCVNRKLFRLLNS